MTKQNRIHKDVCQWEKEHKILLRDMQRHSAFKRTKHLNRKYFRQLDKDFLKRWKKEQQHER